MYNIDNVILRKLAELSPGKERADFLYAGNNRDAVLSSGANVTLYSMSDDEKLLPRELLDSVRVGVLHRWNAKKEQPDGLGTLGGLSERTSLREFASLSFKQKFELIGQRDDIVLSDVGQPTVITDIDIIRKNNVMRETREELGNLGIYDYHINISDMELVEPTNIQDDNYIINIWDGQGMAYAITPYCHILRVEDNLLDKLQNDSQTKEHETVSEAKSYEVLPLEEALTHWGKKGGTYTTNDNRDLTSDYRYPHEYMVLWSLARKVLKNDEKEMLNLIQRVATKSRHWPDFDDIAKRMGKDKDYVSTKILGVQPKNLSAAEFHFKQSVNGFER